MVDRTAEKPKVARGGNDNYKMQRRVQCEGGTKEWYEGMSVDVHAYKSQTNALRREAKGYKQGKNAPANSLNQAASRGAGER